MALYARRGSKRQDLHESVIVRLMRSIGVHRNKGTDCDGVSCNRLIQNNIICWNYLPACRTDEMPRQKQVGQAPSENRGAARQRVHPEVHREALQFFACQPRKLAEEARNQETEAVKSYGGFGTFEPLGP